MKFIIAIIQPDRLDDVMKNLEEKEIHLVTVTNVMGRGRQKGIAEVYRGHKEAVREQHRLMHGRPRRCVGCRSRGGRGGARPSRQRPRPSG